MDVAPVHAPPERRRLLVVGAQRLPRASRLRTLPLRGSAERPVGALVVRRAFAQAEVATVAALAIALVIVAAFAAGCGILGISSNLPDPSTDSARGRDQSTIILDRDDRVVAKLFAEQDRTDRKLKDIPPVLRQAVIATEDRRFYEHSGVDMIGTMRAVFTDIKEGAAAQGGSTITQQYVKQAFVTDEKTLKRKLSEAMLARKLERKYTKDQILELYLNTIYFGRGAYGVEAASQAYFGKHRSG